MPTQPKIVIPGGSGFLGRTLIPHLAAAGWEVVVLSRHASAPAGARAVLWSAAQQEMEGATAVFNLAGRSVNCRYHEANRREILHSRVETTRAVGAAIALCRVPPRVWINASTATIYRHAEDRPMDEATGELGSGFSVDVARAWERAFEESAASRTRKVALRLGIMVDRTPGGTLHYFRTLAQLWLAGPMGTGRQYVSWIHGRDYARAVLWFLEREDLCGVFNCTAPTPIQNYEFLRHVRELCARSWGLPSQRWMLEIGARLIGTETELILKSRRVVPARMLAAGFTFEFPDWATAARDLLP